MIFFDFFTIFGQNFTKMALRRGVICLTVSRIRETGRKIDVFFHDFWRQFLSNLGKFELYLGFWSAPKSPGGLGMALLVKFARVSGVRRGTWISMRVWIWSFRLVSRRRSFAKSYRQCEFRGSRANARFAKFALSLRFGSYRVALHACFGRLFMGVAPVKRQIFDLAST